MASQETIDRLRRMTDLAADDPFYTDELLSDMIDELDLDGASRQIWREKAASVSSLVDITESGSSRSLSQLRKAYLEMAGDDAEEDTGVGQGSFTIGIERV